MVFPMIYPHPQGETQRGAKGKFVFFQEYDTYKLEI